MSVRATIERFLIDGDDRQTQREWCFEVSQGFLTIRRVREGEFGLLIRVEDIPQFRVDLCEAERIAGRLTANEDDEP